MIGIAQTDPHKGCLMTFHQPFSWTWITLLLTKSTNLESENRYAD